MANGGGRAAGCLDLATTGDNPTPKQQWLSLSRCGSGWAVRAGVGRLPGQSPMNACLFVFFFFLTFSFFIYFIFVIVDIFETCSLFFQAGSRRSLPSAPRKIWPRNCNGWPPTLRATPFGTCCSDNLPCSGTALRETLHRRYVHQAAHDPDHVMSLKVSPPAAEPSHG